MHHDDDGNDNNVKYTTAALDNLITQNQNMSPNQAHNTTKNRNFKYDITLQWHTLFLLQETI